ncbi:hypothetical protein VKS41_002483 [Umbelopsis sp. WA50703]
MKITLAVLSLLVAAAASAYAPKGVATLLQSNPLSCHSQVLPLLQKTCRHGGDNHYCGAQNFTALYPKSCPQGLIQTRGNSQCKIVKGKPVNGKVLRNECKDERGSGRQFKKNSPQVESFIKSFQNALSRQPTKSITKRYVKENIRKPTVSKLSSLQRQALPAKCSLQLAADRRRPVDMRQKAAEKIIVAFQKGRMCRVRIARPSKKAIRKTAKKA